MFRLYSEHVPLGDIDGPLLRALGRRGIELAVAAFAGHHDELHALISRATAAGVATVVWPLLDDQEGRWPSASNVESFAAHVRRCTNDLPVSTVLFDLEPPLAWTRAATRWRYAPRPRPRGSHLPLAEDLRGRGWNVEVVVPPMVVYGRRWERWLGTPASELGCERVEPMVYTSLFEGYSRGLVTRRVARDLLVRVTRRSGGTVALGVVGPGALGDEAAYRDIDELREDVALALAAGASRLSLYALDGVLARGSVDDWLDAFVRTPVGSLPPRTRRATILDRIAHLLG